MWGWFLGAAVTGLVSGLSGRTVWRRALPQGGRAAGVIAVLSGAAYVLALAIHDMDGHAGVFPASLVFLGALAIGTVFSDVRERRARSDAQPATPSASRWGLAAFYVGSGVVTGLLASWRIEQTLWSWPLWLLLSTWSYATVLTLGRAPADGFLAKPTPS